MTGRVPRTTVIPVPRHGNPQGVGVFLSPSLNSYAHMGSLTGIVGPDTLARQIAPGGCFSFELSTTAREGRQPGTGLGGY